MIDSIQKQEEFLMGALSKGKLSHSYIFSGIEDMDYAIRIAQKILCKQEHTGCGSCSSCLKIKSHNHPDLMTIEPDGASIKNAQVEAFQEFMVIKPFESDYKITIFNGLHLMTSRAQNRMLKLLEEPPAYGLIIFMTKNIESVLDTVLSRCQILNFVTQENTQIDEGLEKRVFDFVKSLQYKDVNRLFEYTIFAKEDKEVFKHFLALVKQMLRDIMIFKMTQNIQLISQSIFTILDYKDYIPQVAEHFQTKYLVDIIFNIEEVEQKLKSNMNFDLTVDQLLFKCIE